MKMSIDKKLLSLQATRRRKRLKAPFDCPLCEGFQCIKITKREAVLVFRCEDCNTHEVIPIINWANEIEVEELLANDNNDACYVFTGFDKDTNNKNIKIFQKIINLYSSMEIK